MSQKQIIKGIDYQDPHDNIETYLSLVENPEEEIQSLRYLIKSLVLENVSPEEYIDLESGSMNKTERLELLTRVAMSVPFDYLGNARKLADTIDRGELISLEDSLQEENLHYLRTPREVLEDHYNYGTGGDCFSTSFLTQVILSAYGIPARIGLSYDRPSDSEKPEAKHHCIVLAEADGVEYYIDTSLNVEVPICLEDSSDSGSDSSIFRIKIASDEDDVGVSYIQKASPEQGAFKYLKQIARNFIKGAVPLWHFKREGNPLIEVIPSMLYTLHPDVHSSGSYNRNEVLRVNALVENEGTLSRERVFFHEGKGSYLARSIVDQVETAETRLPARHDPETRMIEGDLEELVGYISETFGIRKEAIEEGIAAINQINARTKK